MPRIQILDASRTPYEISSSDPEILAKWLWETIVRIRPSAQWPTEIRVWPLWIGPATDDAVDWPPASNLTFQAVLGADKPVDNVRGLMSALSQYAGMVEGQES